MSLEKVLGWIEIAVLVWLFLIQPKRNRTASRRLELQQRVNRDTNQRIRELEWAVFLRSNASAQDDAERDAARSGTP